jgi:hypothetical protein
MIYIVEIGNDEGDTAAKEYEAQSIRDVYHMAEIDLWDYPKLHVIRVLPKFDKIWPKHVPAW